jgi:type VI secretion system secreted protein Hcp
MVEKKSEPPAAGADIVQRYRFRVRTSDGRELLSHIATVTRPAPPPAVAPLLEMQPALTALAPAELIRPIEPATLMRDVPVHLILVAVKGKKQGELQIDPGFKDAPGKAPHHQFAIQEFSYSVVSPRDPQSGLATGKRMHRPVVFAKELGPSTPQLYSALATNESLTEVIFDCYGTDEGGMVLAHSVKLTNASVSAIDYHQLNVRDPDQMSLPEFAQISVTFEKLEWTHGATVAEDSWTAGG